MDGLQLYWQSEQVLEAIISVGVPLIAFIALSIIAYVGGVELVARVRATAKSIRKYVDEPTDAVVLAVEGVGEFVLRKDLDPKTLSRILTAVADAMGEGVPLAERAEDKPSADPQ